MEKTSTQTYDVVEHGIKFELLTLTYRERRKKHGSLADMTIRIENQET